MRRLFLAIFAIFALAAAPAPPPEVTRTLRLFDFEERRLGNVEDLPMDWVKVAGSDLPHYVNGTLARDRHLSGEYSFRFDLNGGGLIYRYDHGHIQVRPGAHYRVETWCQTTVLPRARARLTAYFTDVDGHLLRNTVRHSELYAASSVDEPWHKLGVELTAGEGAASLVLELELLQPAHYEKKTLGDRALQTQDIRGSAWFDDVSVSQVPKVTLTTEKPGNLFSRGEPMRLSVTVNDQFIEDLAAQLVIQNAVGKTVYQRSGALDLATASDLGPGRKQITLELPELLPGWYEATLVMTSQGKFVGEESIKLIHLADAAKPGQPDERFGVIATDLPPASWRELPELLPMLSAGRVKLALWGAGGDVGELPAGAFDELLDRFTSRGITPTGCLVDVPPRIAEKLPPSGASGWSRLMASDTALWQAEVAYLIARHANHLDRWQLGADGSEEFVTQPAMRQVYRRMYGEFAALIEKPDLAMPWPAWCELDDQSPATVALAVSPSVLPAQLPLYFQDLRQKGSKTNLSLSLQYLSVARYGREAQIRDLAQRFIHSLAGGATRIDMPMPFSVAIRDGVIMQQPDELLIILRSLMTTLSGARYAGKVPVADGVDAFLFDRSGQGILVIWDKDTATRDPAAAPALRELALQLGERPVSIDLWGNVSPLQNVGAAAEGKVSVSVGPTPIFLVDIDGYAARLRASVALDRPLLESSFQPHARKLRFTNSYRHAIGGTVRLKPPPGWTVSPPFFSFNLNPGETLEKDLTLEFPYNSFAGGKTINADFAIQGEGQSAFSVPVSLNLGLSDVGMQTIALRDGNDVVVQQVISNYGDKPINYNAFAIFPGQARQERLVSNLAAGATTIKKYRFKNVNFAGEAKVRAGVKEVDGVRILNEEVAVQ